MNYKLPKHVAIVMDGNGRWAEKKGLPRIEGHKAGVDTVKSIVQCCLEKGIQYLSLFAFSSENWARPPEEVEFLMSLFMSALESEINSLYEQGISVRFTGCREHLSKALQEKMRQAESLTSQNQKLVLNVAVNYSGKWDIFQAVKQIGHKLETHEIKLEDISESTFEHCLATNDLPDPDLFIRTSGELRVSNFFLWQLAYTELYFTDALWPDFTADQFEKALDNYASRERRYGQTSEQLLENPYV